MLGAIIGDVVGSRFEWHNIKTKDFELFNKKCYPTDDSIMTLAVAKALLECDENYEFLESIAIKTMVEIGRHYPDCGFGGKFKRWILTENHEPYNSFGNGSAMRTSAVGYVGKSLKEVKALSRRISSISHNHPEGIKGAEATSVAVYMARTGKKIPEIRKVMEKYYKLNFTIDSIRDIYMYDVSCQGTMPVAIEAFLESENFEDAIRNAISIGGDSDTIAAITGAIAGAYYGVPNSIKLQLIPYLNEELLSIFNEFDAKYTQKTI